MDTLRHIESPTFSVFECVSYIVRNAKSVGLMWELCKRLRAYPDQDVAFYLPQLVHVFVTVETESAALEDFLVELCERSPHCTLLVFWQLQAAITDLADLNQTYGFSVSKRLYNKLQELLFGTRAPERSKIRENASPALVLASMVMGALVPQLGQTVKPLVVAQGRRQRTFLLKRRGGGSAREQFDDADEGSSSLQPGSHSVGRSPSHSPAASLAASPSASPSHTPAPPSPPAGPTRPAMGHNSKSMPNLNEPPAPRPRRNSEERILSHRNLVMNYFKCETQFVYSLQSIANKLVSVPKQARLSALQLELALLNRDLPAEVDIPWLLEDPTPGRQHRIVRISPSEATVLNSAEKTPFLLLVEYLKDDVSFDPKTDRNRYILEAPARQYLFERTFRETAPPEQQQPEQSPPQTPTIESELPLIERDISGYTINDFEELSASQRPPAPKAPEPGQASTPDDIQKLVVQMRTASLILAQLDGADGSKLSKSEIASIKAKIIDNMQAMQDHDILVQGEAGDRKLENDMKVGGLGSSSDDPSAANLGEDWASRKERIRRASPYGSYPNWDLFSVIVKTGDDLRQEALASQIIQWAQRLWAEEGVDVWVKKMGILVTSSSSGLVETITNGLSLHSIKKALSSKTGIVPQTHAEGVDKVPQLSQHFENKFGPRGSRAHTRAVDNFIKSLAAYSLLCYLLQIKDRHNGNILLDNEGHIIHIDFGFMLSNSPGHFGFEAAPFKLTHEYIDLIGGVGSEQYAKFVALMTDSFKVLRRHADEFVRMVEIMAVQSKLPCFVSGSQTAAQLKQRFALHLSDAEVDQFVAKTLVFKSYGSVYTRLYDQFQMVTQGIYS